MTSETAGPLSTDKPKRHQRSLSGRLVTVAAVWSVIALAVAGTILVGLYRAASEKSFDAQLDIYGKSLLAEMVPDPAAADATALRPPKGVSDPRFSLPLSGWYWTVSEVGTKNNVLYASASLVGDALIVDPLGGGAVVKSSLGMGPGNEEVRVRQRRVDVAGETYIITVAAVTSGFRADIYDFAQQVALTLLVFGVGLIGAVFLQVRVGLKPLKRLQESLSNVRRGEAEEIDENLPVELAPLAVELNALIHSNREIVERSRTHVGNLAHGLKTPLSVISNEARSASGPFAAKVSEQAAIMSTQIQHHLERARMAAQRRVIGVSCEVEPVLSRLTRAMSKIYRERDVELAGDLPAGLRFRGEQQDLEELAGNLLDNACKWARSCVSVRIAVLQQEGTARELLSWWSRTMGPACRRLNGRKPSNGGGGWTKPFRGPGWACPLWRIWRLSMAAGWSWTARRLAACRRG